MYVYYVCIHIDVYICMYMQTGTGNAASRDHLLRRCVEVRVVPVCVRESLSAWPHTGKHTHAYTHMTTHTQAHTRLHTRKQAKTCICTHTHEPRHLHPTPFTQRRRKTRGRYYTSRSWRWARGGADWLTNVQLWEQVFAVQFFSPPVFSLAFFLFVRNTFRSDRNHGTEAEHWVSATMAQRSMECKKPWHFGVSEAMAQRQNMAVTHTHTHTPTH